MAQTPVTTDVGAGRGRGVTVFVTALSAAVMTLDATVVNVALADIGTDLQTSLTDLQWVVNGYTLAFAALLLTAGSLSDRLGRRGAFMIGMSVFVVASLACALAPNATVLVGARILQGAGAAFVMGTGLALIAGAYEGEDPVKRQTAVGIFSAGGAAAAALGPLVGGALVDGFGWRSIFLINVPLGIAVVVVTLAMVRPQARLAGTKVDLTGAALAIAMLFALNYGLLTGAAAGWGRADVLTALIVAPLLLVVFLLVERRQGHDAMLDLSLFRIPTFSAAIVLSFAARLTSFGLFPFLILWLAGLLGHTPLQVGLILMVLSVVMVIVAPFSGALVKVAPLRVLNAAGMAVIGAGLWWAALAVGPDERWTAILPGLILIGVGAGIVMPHMMGLAIGVVPAERAGMASGMSNTFFPLGTAVGVAVYGAVMSARIGAAVPDPQLASAAAAGRFDVVAQSAGPDVVAAAARAFTEGLSQVLLIAAVASIISAITALLLIRDRDMRGTPADQAGRAG